jgi:hypothetical protein
MENLSTPLWRVVNVSSQEISLQAYPAKCIQGRLLRPYYITPFPEIDFPNMIQPTQTSPIYSQHRLAAGPKPLLLTYAHHIIPDDLVSLSRGMHLNRSCHQFHACSLDQLQLPHIPSLFTYHHMDVPNLDHRHRKNPLITCQHDSNRHQQALQALEQDQGPVPTTVVARYFHHQPLPNTPNPLSQQNGTNARFDRVSILEPATLTSVQYRQILHPHRTAQPNLSSLIRLVL